MTRPATTTTTRPTAIHVKSPAGRPLEDLTGGFFDAGSLAEGRLAPGFFVTGFFDAGVLDTMLLVKSELQT